ncbi:MAG: carboxynorspermidine decarboxylase [Muribaculaceae bacterium]|nr:carboxynorspermidine decarboxylase [Muribaculaceae bacterium]
MPNSKLSDPRLQSIPTPAYVVYEDRLRENLSKLKKTSEECDVKIIMALKANALWKTFPVVQEYFTSATASSLNEMKLALEFIGDDVHAYCPVYTDRSFPEFLDGCTHITFNSLAQLEKFLPQIREHERKTGRHVSPGLRVNPKVSVLDYDIYNPALPGSRFGMGAEKLPETLPEGLEGMHFHCLCESGPEELEKVLKQFEKDFGKYLPQLKWVNFGGGHLITRQGYDTEHLKKIIKGFKERHPHLEVILEPGSAFTWQTGDLIVEVLDVVEDAGIKTAIIDASFACHMPDCLEMPYKPKIAEALDDDSEEEGFAYRLGGNSCLSGDFVGDWKFREPLKPGDRLTLKDMNHYTTVKTHMFNGISHPSIWFVRSDGSQQLLREFDYEDYKNRMS